MNATRPARILQVGGDDADQRILDTVMRSAGIGDLTVAAPADAVRLVAARAVDLVIVDVLQSSSDVLSILKAAAPSVAAPRHLPVVVTGPATAGDRLHACLQRGADDYLNTPYDASSSLLLSRRIEHALRRHAADANATMRLPPDGVAPRPSNGTARAAAPGGDEAWSRFVPREFLDHLEKRTLEEVQLGDHVLREMTVFFSDIRDFTSLSEAMTPRENFGFLTNYLRHVNPVIKEHGGFIDKYLGDGIMALFPGEAEHGLRSAVNLIRTLGRYNEGRGRAGYAAIRIGIGLHRGSLILGTIGEEQRMQTTVIADAVNLASRIEGMTKTFGVQILVSASVVDELPAEHKFRLRHLGAVKAKGKTQSVEIYECYDTDQPDLLDHKDRTIEQFAVGMEQFRKGMFLTAGKIFARIAELNRDDTVAAYFRDRCSLTVVRDRGLGQWDGAESIEVK